MLFIPFILLEVKKGVSLQQKKHRLEHILYLFYKSYIVASDDSTKEPPRYFAVSLHSMYE